MSGSGFRNQNGTMAKKIEISANFTGFGCFLEANSMKIRLTLLVIWIVLSRAEVLLGAGVFTAVGGAWNVGACWTVTGTPALTYPTAADVATIPAGIIITMPGGLTQQVFTLTIAGALNLSTNGAVLEMFGGGLSLTVSPGGTIADNANPTAINFSNSGSFVNNGVVQCDLFQFNGTNQIVTITGNGTMTTGRFNVLQTGVTVHLNNTGPETFGSNPNPLSLTAANFTIDGTGTLNIGNAVSGSLNVNTTGTSIGCTMTIAKDIAVATDNENLTIANGGIVTVGANTI